MIKICFMSIRNQFIIAYRRYFYQNDKQTPPLLPKVNTTFNLSRIRFRTFPTISFFIVKIFRTYKNFGFEK